VTYTLWVNNTGNCADTFDLSLSGDSWTTEVPATVGPLAAGAGTTVVVTVTVPAGANCGDWDDVTVTATSQGDSGESDSSTLTTSANAVYDVRMGPAADAGSGDPGEEVTYTLSVTNTGNCVDTFDVTVSSNWTTTVPLTVGPLNRNAEADAVVTVTVPAGANCGDWDTAAVTVTSQSDGSTVARSDLTTSADTIYGVEIEPPTDAQWANPGNTVTYTLRVTNAGNCADSFDVIVSGDTWTTTVSPTVGPLGPLGGADLEVTVDIPPGALCSSDSVTVTVTSQANSVISASSRLMTTASTVFGVAVAPETAQQWGDPGSTVTYTVVVTNTGNCPDSFDVTVSGNNWTTQAPATVGPIPVGDGEEVDVRVTITDTASCGQSDTAIVTVAAQGDANISDTSRLTTTANAIYEFGVGPSSDTGWGDPGGEVVYTLRVSNTGNCADAFTVTLGGDVWPTVLSTTDTGSVAAGTVANVMVTVTVPAGAQCGDSDSATVTVTSQGDGSLVDSSTLTTTANPIYDVAVPATAAIEGDPGLPVTYTLSVTNAGNCVDTFNVNVSGNTWPASAPPSIGPIPPGQDSVLQVVVTIPPDPECGASDNATVAVTSQGDGSVVAGTFLTTTARAVYSVSVFPSIGAQSGPPGSTVIHTLRVTNTGNCAETFTIDVSHFTWATSAPASVGPLLPGAGVPIEIRVDIPATALDEEADGALVTATSQSNSAVADSSALTTVAEAEGRMIFLPLIVKDLCDGFAGPYESEDNDDAAQANGPLCAGRDYRGYPDDLSDYYYVTSRGGQITAQMWDYQGGGGQLLLYDENLTVLDRDYDPSDGWRVTAQVGPGRYYIRVFTASNFSTQAAYRLRVTLP
jgi:uncharacterized membrane protein